MMGMGKLDALYRDAKKHNIFVAFCPLNDIVSMITDVGDTAAIALNSRRIHTELFELYCMSHEMAHYHTGAYYKLRSSLQLRVQMEYKADTWMVCDLVPIEDLRRAVRLGYTEVWDLADFFGVPEKVIRRADEIYRAKGLL